MKCWGTSLPQDVIQLGGGVVLAHFSTYITRTHILRCLNTLTTKQYCKCNLETRGALENWKFWIEMTINKKDTGRLKINPSVFPGNNDFTSNVITIKYYFFYDKRRLYIFKENAQITNVSSQNKEKMHCTKLNVVAINSFYRNQYQSLTLGFINKYLQLILVKTICMN